MKRETHKVGKFWHTMSWEW